MALEDLLDHSCNIYHMVKTDKSPGYGLPTAATFSYPEAPDLKGVRCHFAVGRATAFVSQGKPQTTLEGKTKLVLPAGTDIRINDKVVDLSNGMEYTAELPRNIRGHHVAVTLRREDSQKPL